MRQDAANSAEKQQQELPLRSSCLPVQSGSQLPKLRRRTASGSSAESEVRQSLELDATMAAATENGVPSSTRSIFNVGQRSLLSDAAGCDSDAAPEADTKSSSGPINCSSSRSSPVKRTSSLKEQLIHKVKSVKQKGHAEAQGQNEASPLASPKAVSNNNNGEEFSFDHPAATSLMRRSPSPKKQQDSSQEDIVGQSSSSKKASFALHQQLSAKQQQQLNRNRPGSLRGKPVVKVLPDRQLIAKASSSENINQQSDLNTLTSLVLKKRDKSQESLDQAAAAAAAKQPPAAAAAAPGRKAPTPTFDSDDGSDTSKNKPPTGKRDQHSRRIESPTASAPAVDAAAAGVSCNTDRDSPCGAADDLLTPDGEPTGAHAAAGGINGNGMGNKRTDSYEILISDAPSRVVPQIRQPSARQNRHTDSPSRRDPSPSKSAAGSSPPKVVSFNPHPEQYTFEVDSSQQRTKRKPKHRSREPNNGEQYLEPMGDNALIEVHDTLLKTMDSAIVRQRHFLTQVKDEKMDISDYRSIVKTMLQVQTKAIQQMVDAIQSNERNAQL